MSIGPGIAMRVPHLFRNHWGKALALRTVTQVSNSFPLPVSLSPDGKSLAKVVFKVDGGDVLKMWDIPPRKPLAWIIGCWMLLASFFVLLAWWRSARKRASGLSFIPLNHGFAMTAEMS